MQSKKEITLYDITVFDWYKNNILSTNVSFEKRIDLIFYYIKSFYAGFDIIRFKYLDSNYIIETNIVKSKTIE